MHHQVDGVFPSNCSSVKKKIFSVKNSIGEVCNQSLSKLLGCFLKHKIFHDMSVSENEIVDVLFLGCFWQND